MSGTLALAERDPRGRFVSVEVELRLWAKVAGPWNTDGVGNDDRWYFGGRAKNAWGYPRFHWPDLGHPNCGAHIAAFVLTYGQVPAGQVVCHRCNHKTCCNPSHLYAATQGHNIKSAWRDRLIRRNRQRAAA